MRKRHIWGKKLISAVLGVSVALSMAACGGAGAQSGKAGQESAAVGQTSGGAGSKADPAVFNPPSDTPSVIPGKKEESVYVKADANGNPTEKTVEVVLKEISKDGMLPVEDRSDLRDIKNTEGDEEYSSAGDERYLWENHGEDIKYEGKSDKDLPLDVRVTYYLEGQEVTPQEIAGKTGAVRIRFDYDNHTDVPFMALTSAVLSSDVFRDVEVTNGKVVELGDQKAVIGYAFPGLMDILKLENYEPTEEIDLPQYVEIEARTEDFELDFTATVISTGIFDEVEDSDLEDLEEMSDDMDELTDASSEIRDASSELADGGSEFGDYLTQYFDGVSKIGEGTEALDKALQAMNENVSKITEGAESLDEGLTAIEEAMDAVNSSIRPSDENEEEQQAVAEAFTSIGTASAALGEKLSSIGESVVLLQTFAADVSEYCGKVEALKTAIGDNPAPSLTESAEDMAGKLNADASEQATAAAGEAAQNAAEAAVSDARSSAARATAEGARETVRDVINESSAFDGLGLSGDDIAAVKQNLIDEVMSSIAENTGDDTEVSVNVDTVNIAVDETLNGILTEVQGDLDSRYGNITAAAKDLTAPAIPDLGALSSDAMSEITGLLEGMETSLGVITEYAGNLDYSTDALNTLFQTLEQIRAGVETLQEGSGALTTGLGTFEEAIGKTAEGSKALNEALTQVSSAGPELEDAYGQLVDGMEEFADAIAEFDEEGIKSLAELAGPEYLDVIRGVRAARDAEHSCTNFSGICDGEKGSVRFIIETEEISAED